MAMEVLAYLALQKDLRVQPSGPHPKCLRDCPWQYVAVLGWTLLFVVCDDAYGSARLLGRFRSIANDNYFTRIPHR